MKITIEGTPEELAEALKRLQQPVEAKAPIRDEKAAEAARKALEELLKTNKDPLEDPPDEEFVKIQPMPYYPPMHPRLPRRWLQPHPDTTPMPWTAPYNPNTGTPYEPPPPGYIGDWPCDPFITWCNAGRPGMYC
jgi:hypothetical protein